MRRFSILLVVAVGVFASCPVSAFAGGLVRKLPEDGTWVRYAINAKSLGDKTKPLSISGFCTVRSVGKQKIGDDECRWIEIETSGKFKRGTQENDVKDTFKLLIPEKFLVAAEDPRGHVIKAYNQKQDGEVRELDMKGDGSREVQSLDEILHGPLPTVEKLDEMEIDTKLGKLKCAGEKANNGLSFSTETRLHDKAPFGVVTYQYQKRNRMMSFTLDEVGNDAKSALPDSK